MTDKLIRYIGYDSKGYPRVWGEDVFYNSAKRNCYQEAVRYVRRRPDTGPLSGWTFEKATDENWEGWHEAVS